MNGSRPFLSQSMRDAVKKRANYQCERCGYAGAPGTADWRVLEVNHIVPLNKGGRNSLDNLGILCTSCHVAWHEALRLQLMPFGDWLKTSPVDDEKRGTDVAAHQWLTRRPCKVMYFDSEEGYKLLRALVEERKSPGGISGFLREIVRAEAKRKGLL